MSISSLLTCITPLSHYIIPFMINTIIEEFLNDDKTIIEFIEYIDEAVIGSVIIKYMEIINNFVNDIQYEKIDVFKTYYEILVPVFEELESGELSLDVWKKDASDEILSMTLEPLKTILMELKSIYADKFIQALIRPALFAGLFGLEASV